MCILIGSFSILNEVLINVNRFRDKLSLISICETIYNISILLFIALFYSSLSLTSAQIFLFLPLSLSVLIYYCLTPFFDFKSVNIKSIFRLLKLGVYPCLLSATLLAVVSFFIIVPSRFYPPDIVGHYVFANNIASLLLATLNAFIWAITSRSLAVHSGTLSETQRWSNVKNVDFKLLLSFLSVATIGILASFLLPYIFPVYAESGKYIFLCICIQISSTIAFSDINFLMVRNKILPIITLLFTAIAFCFLLLNLLSSHTQFSILLTICACIIILSFSIVTFYSNLSGYAGYSFRRKSLVSLFIICALVFAYII